MFYCASKNGMCDGEYDCNGCEHLKRKPGNNAVDHPSHYNQGRYECIDVMLETFGKEATQNFCLLNAFKYVWRTGEKNGYEDIKKAVWYLNKILKLNGKDDIDV